jgi:hypothetical protein
MALASLDVSVYDIFCCWKQSLYGLNRFQCIVSSYTIFEMECMQLEQQNARFLEAVIEIRSSWEHDKEFTKIVEKMEKGKNLEKNEFAKIHWILWERGNVRCR